MRRAVVVVLTVVGLCVVGGEAWAQKSTAPAEQGAAASQVGDHDGYTVIANPGDASVYRGQNSLLLNIEVTGDAGGSVWGDGIYTDDSSIAAAAVHVGLLGPGQTGVVTIEIVPGMTEYPGAAANGVTSDAFAEWDGSYRFIDPAMIETIPVTTELPALERLRDQQGLIARYSVTGSTKGQIWGDGVYTDDSPIGTAAVHEGMIAKGEKAVVAIEILPGQESYGASATA